MRKKLLTAALALIAPTAALTVTAAPAQAESTPGCITKVEFKAIKTDMKIKRVRAIVGAKGKLTSSSSFSDGDGWKDFEFRQCGKSWNQSSVSIAFEKTEKEVWDPYYEWYDTKYVMPYRVTSKYAYWY